MLSDGIDVSGRGGAAAGLLLALAAVDRGLSALWPASYGLVHPRRSPRRTCRSWPRT